MESSSKVRCYNFLLSKSEDCVNQARLSMLLGKELQDVQLLEKSL